MNHFAMHPKYKNHLLDLAEGLKNMATGNVGSQKGDIVVSHVDPATGKLFVTYTPGEDFEAELNARALECINVMKDWEDNALTLEELGVIFGAYNEARLKYEASKATPETPR